MKRFSLILAAALTALATRAALPQPDLIAQIHFAGGDKVSADKNYAKFSTEFSSPDALVLRKQTADKLAPWLASWLQTSVGTAVPGGTIKLRPLLDDLQSAEWFLEARAAVGAKPDVAIAIKLDAAKAQLWQANLKAFFPAATFKQSAGWLIFDSGTGAVKLGDSLAQKVATPATGWATADVNWPRLGEFFPALKKLDLPETLFQVSADATELLINGKFFFPQNLAVKLDPWQFPSNTVHEPFTSFTAVRGFAGWLNGQDWAQAIKLNPSANQMFTWALKGMPLQSLAAVPVPNATTALRELGAGLQPVVADRDTTGGFFPALTLEVSNTEITLSGAPFIAPYVKTLNEPNGQFLLAGGFPNATRGQPLPSQLFQSLATPNLAFYHWEITAERWSDQLNLSQLALMVTRHHQLDANSAAYKWITNTAPKLGNTVTLVTQTAPDQMTFKRTAPGGLTALEFVMLANWLEAADFPGCNLALPNMTEKFKKLREAHKNQPAQPAPGH